MRYLNWDVLLFPEIGESKTPLQEFGTLCNVTQDPDTATVPMDGQSQFPLISHPVPTVTSYVSSLPTGTPFRVSLHTWAPPVPTRATRAMVRDEKLVYYEAKVLLDGICTAGILFAGGELSWPQIIDGYSREPGYQLFEGKHSDSPADVDKAAQQQLKFPPFHAAMLKEVWADASQNMGRIKIIISEGIYDGQPAPSYQRLRNIVAFSFQHAPLHILEDTGIAWPNPSMWWQAQPQFPNLTSPRKEQADRDAHAHSPRRGEALMATQHAKSGRQSTASPQTCRAYDATRSRGLLNDDPFWSQRTQSSDPFSGSICLENPLDRVTSRNLVGSGDALNPDTSRYGLSTQDVPVPDYSRPLSPASSHRTSHSIPNAHRGPAKDQDNTPSHLGAGLDQQRFGPTLHIPQGTGQVNDTTTSHSPRVGSGISAPSNTRNNSAASTPPGPQRDGSAAVLRAVSYPSYSTQQRSIPVPVNDPPPVYERIPSILQHQQRADTRTPSSNQSHALAEHALRETAAAKKPRGRPKGKKEGRTSDIGLETPVTIAAKRLSTGHNAASGKENNVETDLRPIDSKRKRVHSGIGLVADLEDPTEYNPTVRGLSEDDGLPDDDLPSRKVSKHSVDEVSSPKKHDLEDDLTPEGVITRLRRPLSELENSL